MRYISCLHPVTIIREGKKIEVPCGHCDFCRNRRSQNWIHKLQKERECWQYCYFITLTYDDEHLPVLHYDSENNTLVNFDTGECLDRKLNVKERYYALKRKTISYPNTRDYQLFIKRLRYYFYEYNKKYKLYSKTLRYFLATEYGPTSHRIHAHGLIFFNDYRGYFASQIAELIRKSWQCGNIDCKAVQVTDKAAQYVAKYCNVDNNKFSLFTNKLLRPKIYFSKSPAIGSLLFNSEVIKRIFNSCTPTFGVEQNGKIKDYPLPSVIKNRLFPLVPFFSRLTPTQRVGIYSVFKWSGEFERFEDFAEWLDNQPTFYMPFRLDYYDVQLPISNYLLGLINYQLNDPFSPLKRVWRISRRVCMQSQVFGVSISEYVSKIEKYISNVNFYNLKKFYEFQENVTKSPNAHPIGSCVYLDSNFVQEYLSYSDYAYVPFEMILTLEGYGIDPCKFFYLRKYRESFDFSKYADVTSHIDSISFSYLKTHKVKQKKDYAREHNLTWLANFNKPF